MGYSLCRNYFSVTGLAENSSDAAWQELVAPTADATGSTCLDLTGIKDNQMKRNMEDAMASPGPFKLICRVGVLIRIQDLGSTGSEPRV